MTNYITVIAVLSVVACTTSSSSPGAGSGVDSSQLLPNGSTIEEVCSPPEGPGHPYTTADELSTLIVGTWVLCSGPSLSTTPGSVGMEFDATSAFTQLVAGDGFVTVAPNDFEYGGTWTTYDSYPVLGVTLASDDSVWIDTPAFEDAPRRLDQSSQDSDGNWVQSVYVAID
jgi:hypothetical protein